MDVSLLPEKVRSGDCPWMADKYGTFDFANWDDVPCMDRADISNLTLAQRVSSLSSQADTLRPTSGTSGRGVLLLPRVYGKDNFSDPLHRSVYERNAIKRLATYSLGFASHAVVLAEGLGLSSVQLLPSDIEKSRELVQTFRPDMIAGFAYAIDALVHACAPADVAEVRAVQIFGERPSALQWRTLRESLPHAEVFSEYASIEAQSSLGVGCQEIIAHGEPYFHPFEHYVYMEIVDPETGAVITDEDVAGELVITLLRENAMPLVRYRTGDVARRVQPVCSCARPTFVVDGRITSERVRVLGGEIQLAEIERALLACLLPIHSNSFRVFLYEEKSETGTRVPRLVISLVCNPHECAAFAHSIAESLRIAPNMTYAQAVEKFGYAPLEVVPLESNVLGKARGIEKQYD